MAKKADGVGGEFRPFIRCQKTPAGLEEAGWEGGVTLFPPLGRRGMACSLGRGRGAKGRMFLRQAKGREGERGRRQKRDERAGDTSGLAAPFVPQRLSKRRRCVRGPRL